MTEVSGQKSDVRKLFALGALPLALSFLSTMLLALSLPVEAQQVKKIAKIRVPCSEHRRGYRASYRGVQARSAGAWL